MKEENSCDMQVCTVNAEGVQVVQEGKQHTTFKDKANMLKQTNRGKHNSRPPVERHALQSALCILEARISGPSDSLLFTAASRFFFWARGASDDN